MKLLPEIFVSYILWRHCCWRHFWVTWSTGSSSCSSSLVSPWSLTLLMVWWPTTIFHVAVDFFMASSKSWIVPQQKNDLNNFSSKPWLHIVDEMSSFEKYAPSANCLCIFLEAPLLSSHSDCLSGESSTWVEMDWCQQRRNPQFLVETKKWPRYITVTVAVIPFYNIVCS